MKARAAFVDFNQAAILATVDFGQFDIVDGQ
jgi:hypothetical protein